MMSLRIIFGSKSDIKKYIVFMGWGNFYRVLIGIISSLFLSGCPGTGKQLRPDEQTVLKIVGGNVCLVVPDAGDYQPAVIAINPRGAPSRDQSIIFEPTLQVTDEMLCIPPTFYHFPKQGQFIIKSVLTSKKYPDVPREMVTGLAFSEGYFSPIPLTDSEILRPYSELSHP